MKLIRSFGKKISSKLGDVWLGQKIEQRFINMKKSYYAPPIFIIGLPRSGSTLLYQLLTHYFKVAYFSNLSSTFYTYPATITYLTLPFHKKYKLKSFESNYGFTSGLFAPSEAGAVYRYWFGETRTQKEKIYKTCVKISDMLQRPFVWKNLNLSYKIDELSKIFPDALFVLIERDLEYICQSVYKRTIDGPGLGIKGLTKAELYKSKDMLQTIAQNIKLMNNNIFESIDNCKVNFIKIEYTNLCNNYSANLEKISEVYHKLGNHIDRKVKYAKHQFSICNLKKISVQEWDKLINYLYS
ncbi:MAG: sulfotransferase family protein [Candidatus Helarchaeota archaeon]